MKRFPAVLALTALAAAAVGVAQQTPPSTEPPASTSPQEQSPNQSAAPSDPGARTDPSASPNSDSRREQLMKDCISQVTTANPGVAAQDIKNFCDKEVNQASTPQG